MPYLIDGHNLIGALPDIRLDEEDDETRLIERLAAFCRKKQKQVEVYFDKAAPGRAGKFRLGAVTAIFVTSGSTADAAIARRLDQLGRTARNWIVVTSDNAVQSAARSARARIVSAQAFSVELDAVDSRDPGEEIKFEDDEVDAWLRLFGEDPEG
jgi:predicted RNA-binding protein with PIN domain